MNVDGSDQHQVFLPSCPGCEVYADRDPQWSPDGNQIVFIRDGASVTSGLVVMNADGTNARTLPYPTGESERLSDPAWSPDGKTIAYSLRSVGTARYFIRLTKADGSGGSYGLTGLHSPAETGGSELEAAWSPDSRRIAFTSGPLHQATNVSIINADGSNLRSLAPGSSPSWSPRGDQIAFSNAGTVSIIGVDGTGTTALTQGVEPSWEPMVPQVVPGSVSVNEGNSGTKIVQIPVTLSAPTSRTVTVSWTTLDGTSATPSTLFSIGDFTPASGTVTFAPGQTTATVPVSIVGDTLDETDELVGVSFTNPTNATIGGFFGLGFAVITDDDPPPVIVPGIASRISESDTDFVDLVIPVTLSAPSGLPVTASWKTVNNTATAPDDYVAASGTTIFVPGQTTGAVRVLVRDDTLDEPDETLLVSFKNPVNATLGGIWGLGIGTITDDDPPPTIVPGQASIIEGNSGTKVLQVPVSLSAPSGQAVTASWITLDDSAVSPGDFTAASATVTFTAGETTKTVAVIVRGDTVKEPNERFFVSFKNPVNATIGGIWGLGFANITNDD
jgi:chitinase